MTDLTEAQRNRLDKIEEEEEYASVVEEGVKIVGYHPKGGPILRHSDGRHTYINEHGRMKPVAKQFLKEDK